MSAVISQKKGWVVTQEAFERMLAELHPDVERAGEQHEKIRRKLVKLFEWRACPDAEECADETFNRVAQKICEGASIWTDEPYSYFHGVALYVLTHENDSHNFLHFSNLNISIGAESKITS